MEGLLREFDYFEPKVRQPSIMGDYHGVFGTGQAIVQRGPIEYFVRVGDELSLDVDNSKVEIKLKITLENGNDLGVGDSVWNRNDIPMG